MKLRLLPLKPIGLVKVQQEPLVGHSDGEPSIPWTEKWAEEHEQLVENPLRVVMHVSSPKGDPWELSHWGIFPLELTYPLFNIVVFRAKSTFQITILQLNHGDNMSGSNFVIMNDHGGLARCKSYIIKSLKRKGKVTTLFIKEKGNEGRNNPEDHNGNRGTETVLVPDIRNSSVVIRSHWRP